MIASAFIGGFEMLVVATFASFLTGFRILRTTETQRRARRLLGVALITLGGSPIVFFIVAYVYNQVIGRP